MSKPIDALIAQAVQNMERARQEGILLEAALDDSKVRYGIAQGRLMALKEVKALIDDAGDPEKTE